MTNRAIFETYLAALRRKPVAEKTEHTDRGALEALLAAFAAEADGKPEVQHEPRRVASKGAPDFKEVRKGLIQGYVENKAIGEDLKKVVKSGQIERYRTLSQNLLLTDYLEFIWISKDGQQRAVLCSEDALENRKAKLTDEAIAAVAKLLEGFFSSAPQKVANSEDLALALAKRSRLLRDYLTEELVRQEKEHQEGRLYLPRRKNKTTYFRSGSTLQVSGRKTWLPTSAASSMRDTATTTALRKFSVISMPFCTRLHIAAVMLNSCA
jgi:hypothetical protein